MKPTRPYVRTGLNALKARVKVRGLHAIDQRTASARALIAWRRDLLADLGGEAACSAQQRMLVEDAVRARLYLDHLDAYLLEQASLVNMRRRIVVPVLVARQQIADHLLRVLGQLGLERRAPAAPTLGQLLAARATAAGAAPAASPTPSPGPGQEEDP
jgi:hypothetical protein